VLIDLRKVSVKALLYVRNSASDIGLQGRARSAAISHFLPLDAFTESLNADGCQELVNCVQVYITEL